MTNQTNQTNLNDDEVKVLRSLRERGFAVCVFTPDEVNHSDPCDVEDSMCQAGWNQINFDTPAGERISA